MSNRLHTRSGQTASHVMAHVMTKAAARESGFSLVELMVATTISLVMFSGLSFVMISAYNTSKVQSGVQDVQENGRLGLEMIARDIRAAGFVGCSEGGIGFTNNLKTAATPATPPAPVKGFEHRAGGTTQRKWYPSDADDPIVPLADDFDSDMLLLTYAANTEYQVAEATADTFVKLNTVTGISVGDILYLSNCKGSDLFQVSAIDIETSQQISHTVDATQAPGNKNDVLKGSYNRGDNILRFTTAMYYVADDTLFRSPSASRARGEAFLPGVENMQVLYGEDTAGNKAVDVYKRADAVTNWNAVHTIRLALLIRTDREYGLSADINNSEIKVLDETICFPDPDEEIICPPDEEIIPFPSDERYRRRVFSTTVEIRNAY